MRRAMQCYLFMLVLSAVAGCAALPENAHRNGTAPAVPPADSQFAATLQQEALQHPGQSGFLALGDGMEALAARLALVNSAQSTLDLQYYIWHHDLVGNFLFHRLLEAADRGVRVRLLLDDLDTAGKDRTLLLIDAHPNLEIRLFNPFARRKARWLDFITSTSRLNHRMHNKALIADNAAGVLGGRNIGDEYFDAAEDIGFSDMDVLAVGPVTEELSASFDLYWSSDWSYSLQQLNDRIDYDAAEVAELREQLQRHAEQARESDYAAALVGQVRDRYEAIEALDYHWGRWALVYDQPQKVAAEEVAEATHLAPKLKQAMDAAEKDLVIVSPYFVPGEEFTDYLVARASEGVRVRVLTNSLAANDVSLVHAGYRRYRKDLVRGGVELYEFKAAANEEKRSAKTQERSSRWSGSSRASLHGKYLGFDQRYVFVGSFNLDARSVALNTELGVYFEDPSYARLLDTRFDERAPVLTYRVSLDENNDLQWVTWENGERRIYDHEPDTTAFQRFVNRVLSVFVPESQL